MFLALTISCSNDTRHRSLWRCLNFPFRPRWMFLTNSAHMIPCDVAAALSHTCFQVAASCTLERGSSGAHACALTEKVPFAIHGVVSNSAIIRLSLLPSSFPSPLPLSRGSIHILITAFPSPALRHSIRALPVSGFALLLPPLCDHSLFSEAHQN